MSVVERVLLLSDRYYRHVGLSIVTNVPLGRGHDTTLGRFPRTAGGLRLVRKLAAPRGSYTELSDAGNYIPYQVFIAHRLL